MAYTPTQWNDGDTITAEKMNHLEQGVAQLKDGQVGPVGPAGPVGPTGAAGAKGEKGETGAAGKGVKSIALMTDSSGKVTGGTVTFSDNTNSPITVTTAGG